MKIIKSKITSTLAVLVTLLILMGTLFYAYNYTVNNSGKNNSFQRGNGRMQQGGFPQGGFEQKGNNKFQGAPRNGNGTTNKPNN